MSQFMGVILAIKSLCVAVVMEKANIVCTVAYSLLLEIELHNLPIFLGAKTKRNSVTLQSHNKKKRDDELKHKLTFGIWYHP